METLLYPYWFYIFQFFYHYFIIYTYPSYIAASNVVIDDVTTHKSGHT